METWRYLKFDTFGHPKRNCVLPDIGTFCWGFDLEDHKRKICFRNDDGHFLVVKEGRLSSVCLIAAWAPIVEEQSEPDMLVIRKCGNYWPPHGSLEYERKVIRVHSRGKARSSIGQNVADTVVAEARSRLAKLKLTAAGS